MATKILIPTPLRPYTDKKDAVEAEGATVGELLLDLTARHAGLKAHLYNDQGKLRIARASRRLYCNSVLEFTYKACAPGCLLNGPDPRTGLLLDFALGHASMFASESILLEPHNSLAAKR